MAIRIFYGTESGNAMMLSEEMGERLGVSAVDSLDDLQPSDMDADTDYIIVSSTFGSGELPATAAKFGAALKEKPDLSHVRFAIFGLGDSVNFEQTFTFGSKTIMEDMIAAGATMIGERGIYDAGSNDIPEDIAAPWFDRIVELFQSK